MTSAEHVRDSLGRQQHDHFLQLRIERIARLRQIRETLWMKWDGECALCHRQMESRYMTIDHICPKSRGGVDELYNLRPLCKSCHGELNTYRQCLGAMLIARGTQ